MAFNSFFKIPRIGNGVFPFHVGKESVAAWGMVIIALVLIFLFLWDIRIFLTFRSENPVPEISIKKPLITEREIEEAIEFLDAREKRQREILTR